MVFCHINDYFKFILKIFGLIDGAADINYAFSPFWYMLNIVEGIGKTAWDRSKNS